MENFQLSQTQWLKQSCINICCHTYRLLISSSCLLCSLISKQSFINQPMEKWHDWEDWWCCKLHLRIFTQIHVFDKYLGSYCRRQSSTCSGKKQMHYFLQCAFKSFIINYMVLFLRKQIKGKIILNIYWKIFFLVILPSIIIFWK